MRLKIGCFVLFILLCSGGVKAQIQFNKASVSVLDSSKKINYYIVDPASKTNSTSQPQNTRYIVRLKSEPLIKASRNSRAGRTQDIEVEHNRFKTDVSQSGKNSTNGRSRGPVKIHFEYKNSFNGFAIEASADVIEKIKKYAYVSAVLEDKTVRAYDITSNEIIGAPKVWNDLKVTGKGVRIGIIDTGIDYNHYDLGGGFGSAFKVKGGYDFVNSDNDPMDDNGHGTHVAGIAAANGPGLKGVAPDALLYAYKALGRDGSGVDSWILAAIERCTDPDQNPNTDDALDIVNMSLGRPVDASEPISEAVNNAVAKGVVFVVAAGNDYDYGTIGTPGVAEQAITVGATDQYDFTANFSSKGPVKGTYALKPEVAAPGVDIYSASPNNSYQQLSGTSMASPHVAGAVALLLEKHPMWSPQLIKSALMQSAKPSTESIFSQGAGRIDISKAINQEVLFTHGSISLGLLDHSQPIKTFTVSIDVHNVGETSRQISLSTENSNSNISVTVSQSNFTLPKHSTKNIITTLTINTSALPYLNFPDAYIESIKIFDGKTTTTIPLTILNPSITKLVFTGELPQSIFQVGHENYYFSSQYPSGNEVDLMLPPGQYDLISLYGNRIVVNEGINGNGGQTIVIDKAQAKNVIQFTPKDNQGKDIPYDANTLGSVTFTGERRNFICFFPYVEDTVYVSDQSAYYLSMRLRDNIQSLSGKFYDVSITTAQGISSSGVYSNNQSDFVKLNISNPGIDASATQQMIYHSQGSIFGLLNTYPLSVSNPTEIYYSKRAKKVIDYTFIQLNPQAGVSGYPWELGGFKICDNDSIYFFDSQRSQIATAKVNGDQFDYNLGESLIRLNARTYNNETQIKFHDFPSRGAFNHAFGERPSSTVFYKIKKEETVLKSGSFVNKTTDEFSNELSIQYEATPAPYTISLKYEDYFVDGKFGAAKADLKFDMTKADKNPPAIHQLSLKANNIETNHFNQGESGKIKIGINDLCLNYYGMECNDQNFGIQSVELKIKNEKNSDWTNLVILEQTQPWDDFKMYESTLPLDLSLGYYDISIKATDLSDNSINYEITSGFLIGEGGSETFTRVALIEPKQNSYGTGVSPLFKWGSIANVNSYVFQVSDSKGFETTQEFTSSNEYYQLSSSLENNRFYYWRVKAMLQDNTTPWSSIGNFYTGNPFQAAAPISPTNAAVDQPLSINFKWMRAKDQEAYAKFELSTTPDFSYYDYLNYTADTSLTVATNLYPNTQYYWRITTTHYFNNQYYEVSSPTFIFSTIGSYNINLLQPVQSAHSTGVSPSFSWDNYSDVTDYILQLSADNFTSVLSEQTVNATSIQLPFPLEKNKFYSWKVGAVKGQNITWSETRTFFTGDPFQSVNLTQPTNHAVNQPLSVNFKWLKSFTNVNYKFQLAMSNDFSSIEFESYLSDTILSVNNLNPSQQYFWRVVQDRVFNGNSFSVNSPVYSFSTTTITGTEDPLSRNVMTAYPNPFDKEIFFKFYNLKPGDVSFAVVNSLGRPVAQFSKSIEYSGETIISWDGTNDQKQTLPVGVYIIYINAGTFTGQLKVVLTK